MKRILLLNSSFRKKNTFRLLQNIGNVLKDKGFQVEYININQYEIKGCRGCEQCIQKDSPCFIKDGAEELIKNITEYDGIVIGTPVYMGSFSGSLKLLIDRTSKWFHRTEIAGKPVILVSTTAGSGLKNTLNSLEKVLDGWGVNVVSKIGRTISKIDDPLDKGELDRFINYVNNGNRRYKPSTGQIISFNIKKVLAENIFPLDKEYWEKKNWLTQDYYYSCKVNPFKKILGKGFYKMMKTKIKPIK